MKKLIDHTELGPAMRRCYNDYCANHADSNGMASAYRYYLEIVSGLKLEFGYPGHGKGWQVSKAEVVDEKVYLMWLMRWA